MSTRSLIPSGHSPRKSVVVVLSLLAVACASQSHAQQTPADTNAPGAVATTANQSLQSVLPDTPSATRLVYSSATSLALEDRFRAYGEANSRQYSVLGLALGGISQWENGPLQWKQGNAGYGHYVTAGVSRQAVAESIRVGLAAFDGEDPRYHRSEDTSVFGRARHAFVGTFTSETANGSRMPAYSRFAGAYGAAFISNSWYSGYYDSRATAAWAMRRGSTAIASSIGLNLLQEFAPRNKYFKVLGLSKDTR